MKKLFFILIIFFTANFLSAQNTGAVKLGHFSPGAMEGGFIIGYEGGKYIDHGINIGFSVDWFHKSFADKNLIRDGGGLFGVDGGSINELRAKTNLNDFPLMLNLTAKFPMAPYFKFFVEGGVGGEILLISYSNFLAPEEDEFKAAFDFNWRTGIGLIYELGYRSEIFGEVSYHSSAPSWEYEVYDPQIGRNRTYERSFDMSGAMFRIGFRFYY